MTLLLLFNITNGLIIGAFYVLMALGLSLGPGEPHVVVWVPESQVAGITRV